MFPIVYGEKIKSDFICKNFYKDENKTVMLYF